MKKKLSTLLALCLLLAPLLPFKAQAAGETVKRIGLSYLYNNTDTRVAAANLRNKSGWGYNLGYYDAQRQFVTLGWTTESKISVLITQNQYLTSSGGYSYTDAGRGTVGCFHVQLPGTYADFSSAQAAAETVDGGFVAWVKGTYYVRAGSYNRRAAAQEAADAVGGTLGETSGYGYSVVPAGSTKILFQFDADQDGESGAFGVLPLAGEGVKPVTSYNENLSCYGGFRFERIGGGESTVVNMIELEDYVKCVVPYEMSTSWPLEALKAQAVCARTYAGGSRQPHAAQHFDLCPTTDCQAYKGAAGVGDSTNQAVDETAGQMLYYNGKRIDALYYSSNGGASEDNKNVNGYDHPYLKGKIDPYEEYAVQFMSKSQLSYYRWTKTWTAADLQARLNGLGYTCAEISNITTKLSPTGNVIAVTVTDSNGKSNTFERGRIRSVFNLNSIRFSITSSGGAQAGGYAIAGAANAPSIGGLYAISGDGTVGALGEESYVITQSGVQSLIPAQSQNGGGGEKVFAFNGTGWGHNVGMSQWGAYAMAKQGYGYRDILNFYYTDITIQ